ncbi:MAG: 23S rRNA (uracil(1939)-C(5))-methyltransferase RlmD, partial [Lachnospiraceae bacterium]|nr:23S rRNA (uracil(1939)-C(5))-methyltransferase RlmD [Lachnospiraceae bacterium]
MAYLKNQILDVEITDISDSGEGIGKVDGYTLFVKDALIGDKVKARLTKVKKNYSFARLEEIITPSKDRVTPPCKYHRQCGGCQIQAMSYEAQLKFKYNKVKNDLVRIGGFDEEFIESISEPIIGIENPFRYRNKAQYPVGLSKDGQIIAGFYAGRTHSIISNTNCLLGCEENERILETIISYMNKNEIAPYDEVSGRGIVRHVLIRKGFTTSEIMVCVVINADRLKNEEMLVSMLTENPDIKSISINVNKKNTNVILGDKCRTLFGTDTITDYIGDVKFKISPLSFFQVNPVQTKKLYGKALEYADLSGNETVWDLYCGIGTISLFLAKKAKHVFGIEIVPEAISDAKENAKINGIENASFYTGAAEDLAPELLSGKLDSSVSKDDAIPDVIVVDPPRKGCDETLLNTILSVKPERIVYVSCDPATLSRDLKILTASGEYELRKVCAVDQFSQTVHVETV